MGNRTPSRIRETFGLVRAIAVDRLPWLAGARVRTCREADRDHRRRWRLFAHSNHYPMTVCFAQAAEKELLWQELAGVSAHEFGHLAALCLRMPAHMKDEQTRKGKETPQAVQDEADTIAARVIGIPVRYNERSIQEADIAELMRVGTL